MIYIISNEVNIKFTILQHATENLNSVAKITINREKWSKIWSNRNFHTSMLKIPADYLENSSINPTPRCRNIFLHKDQVDDLSCFIHNCSKLERTQLLMNG